MVSKPATRWLTVTVAFEVLILRCIIISYCKMLYPNFKLKFECTFFGNLSSFVVRLFDKTIDQTKTTVTTKMYIVHVFIFYLLTVSNVWLKLTIKLKILKTNFKKIQIIHYVDCNLNKPISIYNVLLFWKYYILSRYTIIYYKRICISVKLPKMSYSLKFQSLINSLKCYKFCSNFYHICIFYI